MNARPTVPPLVMIPENAPFSAEQRAWLSGLLVATLIPDAQGAAVIAGCDVDGSLAGAVPAVDQTRATNDDAPWHDPAMPLTDRMDLASGRPMAPRLMAAMAQQDCGQCGYNCADYANAIADQAEARLTLCAPGGKETARMLKQLALELTTSSASVPAVSIPAVAPNDAGTFSRDTPASVVLSSRRLLNGPGSEKETWHIELKLSGSGLTYSAGDSFGVFPHNHLGLVDQVIALLGASHLTEIRGRTLRQVLAEDVSLGIAPDSLFELLSFISGGELRAKARALACGEDPDGDASNLDVLAALQKFSKVRPHPEAFVDTLDSLQPRLYSISSSPLVDAERLSLTVDTVRYVIGKRKRFGVASTWLAERLPEGATVKAYVQKAHNFSLPSDPSTPVIMIGPGTGIAPFRAFLQERDALRAIGKNWFFFGHQHQLSDFYYREELEALRQKGVLTRLSLAWSRDGAEKFYVQDRMREVGSAIWQWLAEGAHIYICGDAKRMAKDVEAALVDIVSQHGVRSTDDAIAFISQLKKSQRFQADVY